MRCFGLSQWQEVVQSDGARYLNRHEYIFHVGYGLLRLSLVVRGLKRCPFITFILVTDVAWWLILELSEVRFLTAFPNILWALGYTEVGLHVLHTCGSNYPFSTEWYNSSGRVSATGTARLVV